MNSKFLHQNCELTIKHLINLLIFAYDEYLLMSNYFHPNDDAMKGLKTRLNAASDFEWNQSVNLLEYFYKRGGDFELVRNPKWKKFRWRSAFEIIEYSRELDAYILKNLGDVHGLASKYNDEPLQEFILQMTNERKNSTSIKEIYMGLVFEQ